MRIHAALMPSLAGDVTDAVCVVIDVLRATTVVATLFARDCPRVYVAASHEMARTFARENGFVLCGEAGGQKVEGFDYGNSPVEFASLDFTGRPVVLSTTNGTKATAAVARARRVFLGAAVNCAAVAKAAWAAARAADADVVLVCSGTDNEFTLEDATVAGLYVEALTAQAGAWEMPELADSAIACRRLWQSEPNLLRGWMEGAHACRLGDIGFGEDVGYSAARDTLTSVPTLVTHDDLETVMAPVLLVR